MQKQLSDLLQKEMTRKEFVATLGFGAATIMGFGSIIQLVTGHVNGGNYKKATQGYGASVYGGSLPTKS